MRLAFAVLALALTVIGQESAKPSDWNGWMEKGGSDSRSGRFAEAVVDFQQAIDLNPDHPALRVALASAYMAQYVPDSTKPENLALAERARAEYGLVLQNDPRNIVALRTLGSLSLQQAQTLPEANRLNKLDDARDWFHRVIEVDAQAKDALYSLGLADWFRFSPDWMAARAQLGLKPEDSGPLPDAAVRQALITKYGGAIDRAVTNLRAALELDPEYADALVTMASVARVRADLDDSPGQYRADIALANQWGEKARAAEKLKSPERLRVAGEVQAAKLISKVEPVYPAAAQQQRIQGTVQLRAIVGGGGRVVSTQFVSGPELLVKAAQEAVRSWVYQPTMYNGRAVEVITYIEVTFALR